MDKNEHLLSHVGIQGTKQNVMVPTNLVYIVVGPGRSTWDRNTQKNMRNSRKINIPASLGTNKYVFCKNTKTKMTALTRFIDLESGWADLY